MTNDENYELNVQELFINCNGTLIFSSSYKNTAANEEFQSN